MQINIPGSKNILQELCLENENVGHTQNKSTFKSEEISFATYANFF